MREAATPLPSLSRSERATTFCDGTASGGRGGSFPECFDELQEMTEDYEENDSQKQRLSKYGLAVGLASWPVEVLRNILNSGASYGAFVHRCIQGCRGVRSSAAPEALFPIPLPLDDVWSRNPNGLGKERRLRLAYRRMVHLCVMALNFMHSRQPFSDLPTIWRCPGPRHVLVHSREEISILGCGRKSFQLSARYHELLQAVQSYGLDEKGGYTKKQDLVTVPVNNQDVEELVPYRLLQAERLKISGTGSWDCRDFLSDHLYMVFCEPRVFEFEVEPPVEARPDVFGVQKSEVEKLMKVWDLQGLLRLYPSSYGPKNPAWCVKVFNNYKDKGQDRQIGDRRSMNFREGRVAGPSRSLPTGASLLQVSTTPRSQSLYGSTADRKDFYHQFWLTDEKASYNAVFPYFQLQETEGLEAHKAFLQKFPVKRRAVGREGGDFLHGAPKPILSHSSLEVVATFGALFQGDHIGVEVATDSHARLLQDNGLLKTGSRLSSASFIYDDRCVDGLIIDDYCVVSKENVGTPKEESQSVAKLGIAQRSYDKQGLMGSKHKDVIGENLFKFAGAEVVSTEASVARGVVALGAPFSKRLGLGLLSSKAASLRSTTDALWSSMVGSWISVLLYRRPCMAMLSEVFKVIPAEELDTQNPKLRHLPRRAAEELLVLSSMAPSLSSNLATEFLEEIYAADASNAMGGVTVASIPLELAKILWRSSEQKAENVPMMRRTEAILASHGEAFEERPFERVGDEEWSDVHPERPIALSFQFIEICGGAGVVTRAIAAKGVVCGPVLDISFSKQYDMKQARVLQWIIYLLEEDRLESFLMAPPCTTFSPAAYPSLRSYAVPRGYDPSNERVIEGNQLAFAMLCLLYVAWRMQKLAMGEQPRRSKMRRLLEWQRLLLLGASEVVTASCMFGSKHMK